MSTLNVGDNLQQQIDEIEALASIYGDDWCSVDTASRCYCIGIDERNVGVDERPAKWRVALQVLMPDEYPSHSPPVYQLNASWLCGQEREELVHSLEGIHSENLGECVIYLWVERIRQFLQDKSPTDTPSVETKVTEEEECDDLEVEDDTDWSCRLSDEEHDKSDDRLHEGSGEACPDIQHGDPMTDRRSTFQAHLARVADRRQVAMVIEKLYQNKKIANATHNIYAYRIKVDSGAHLCGCDDDGETQAGSRMLHLLKITDVENVVVVVSRWYGGIQLGPDRFKHINNCTRNILVQHNYITVKESSNRTTGKKNKNKS